MGETTINCAEACVNGCVLGDKCPHREHLATTSKFLEETSLDRMIEIAQESLAKRLSRPPQWVLPDEE